MFVLLLTVQSWAAEKLVDESATWALMFRALSCHDFAKSCIDLLLDSEYGLDLRMYI